jgi:hypothetical protein
VTIFGAIFAVIVGIFAVGYAFAWRQEKQLAASARDWPTAEATVVDRILIMVEPAERKLRVHYAIGPDEYVSVARSFLDVDTSRIRVGDHVRIKYAPENPTICVVSSVSTA